MRKKIRESIGETMEFKSNLTFPPSNYPRNQWWSANKEKFKKLNNTAVPSRDYYEGHYNLKNLISDFNHWLFDYCFNDIISTEEK